MNPFSCPQIVLVGAGVVGTTIAKAHLDRGIAVVLADQNDQSLRRAARELADHVDQWAIDASAPIGGVLPCVRFSLTERLSLSEVDTRASAQLSTLVIESIVERLDVKRAFFQQAEEWFGADAIFCSNTSTIQISSIAASLTYPERLCGMHFFMPVDRRPAVEVISSPSTCDNTTRAAQAHVQRLGKQSLVVADSPGFVVNRMLAPYLGQAMTLLCAGIEADRIEAAAKAYGMPMSPLELIDWISTRTTFDAGRVYWQAFPSRIDPSPLIAALVKRGRGGRSSGGGFFDYEGGVKSENLSPTVIQLAANYHRDLPKIDDETLIDLLAIPMWIEAQNILADRVVDDFSSIETAMSGGLGFQPHGHWQSYFDRLGHERIERQTAKWSGILRTMANKRGVDF